MKILVTLVVQFIICSLAFATEGHGETPSLFSLDFLYRVINFVILFGGIGYVLSKPVKRFLKERSNAVKQAIEEAKKAKMDAEAKARFYEEKLANLDAEITALKEQFKKEAEEEKSRIVREVEEQIAKAKERMEKSLEQERLKMREDVMKETVSLALTIAEEIIKRNVTKEDHKKWIEEYIKMMERIH